jgi:hypothetical protein
MDRSSIAFARQALVLLVGAIIALVAWPALADPPSRAIRISLISGSASFSPAGSEEWLQARVNRPIWIGDRLWSGDGRVELQLGGASLRLAPGTSLQVLNFDDRIAQFEVTQGTVALHVRVIDRNDAIEIDTPTFAFVAREEGDYRIDVERDFTAVGVRRGVADVYGQETAYRVDRREQFAFYSADLRDYDAGPLPRADAFDRWVRERAQREDRSASARYVSPELVGYVDLDQHGEWRTHSSYGAVWVPRVAANWAPYRYGHWSWIDPWGWTWIDDAPWGFAPSHYGRWTRIDTTWAWVPGPRTLAPVYAPALVAWVGGDNFQLSVSAGRTRGVGWFPLAPGEIWRPAYDVSRDYFTRVNVNNTVVNNTTVVNVYNTRNDVRISNVDYRFRAAPAAVTAVPVETFVQSRPVQQAAAKVNATAVTQASVLAAAPAQPVVQSIVGNAPRAQARPPEQSMQRSVVARTAPPAAVPTIENRAAMVREGKPIDRSALERAAPQAAKPPTPPVAQPGTPQPPAARAPARPAEPRQLSANVRVVDAEKAQPKPVPPAPPTGQRAARPADKDDARAARTPDQDDARARGNADKDGSKSQQPRPAQSAQPARDVTAPPKAEPRPPERQQPPQAAPPPSQPPRASPPRGEEAPPPRGGPPSGRPEDRPGRPDVPAAKPTAPAPAPVPVVPPRGEPVPKPAAEPPNVDQLRGREEAPVRRGRELPVPQMDERRAQPVTPPPRAPESAARPPATPTPMAQPARPQPDDARRPAPVAQQPQRAQEPSRPDAARAASTPAAPPNAQPPAPRAPDAERTEPRPAQKGKGNDEDEEKEKDKNKGKGKS